MNEYAMVMITKNEKQTLVSYQAKCFVVKKVPLDIEWTMSCKKDQICCLTFFPVVWSVFYRNCSRKFVKDFGGCCLVQIDLLVLVTRRVMVQLASYFLYIFVTRRQQIETSFSCLRRSNPWTKYYWYLR